WESGAVLRTLAHPARVDRVGWRADGRMLAAACYDHQVHLWDPETGARLRTLEGHESEVVRAVFNHGGDLLASSGWDGQVRLWDPTAFPPLLAYLSTAGSSAAAYFHPDGKSLITDGSAGQRRWPLDADTDGGGVLRVGSPRLLAAGGGVRNGVALSRDGRTLS